MLCGSGDRPDDRSPSSYDLLESNHEGGAAVQTPGFLAGVVVHRSFFTERQRAQPAGGDAAARQVVTHSGGAPLTERLVVFGGADVAGVALDLEIQFRVVVQRGDSLVEDARGARS